VLEEFTALPEEVVRQALIQSKGIGNWTIAVYLMFVLQRADIFPIGDLAAINALRSLKKLDAGTTREDILALTEQWKPFRSVACMLLWHYYLPNKGKRSRLWSELYLYPGFEKYKRISTSTQEIFLIIFFFTSILK